MTAALLAKVAAPETVTVLAKVPADATESACRLVLPPPVGTVRPPAEIVRPPLEMVTAPADWHFHVSALYVPGTTFQANMSRVAAAEFNKHLNVCMVTCQGRGTTDAQAA